MERRRARSGDLFFQAQARRYRLGADGVGLSQEASERSSPRLQAARKPKFPHDTVFCTHDVLAIDTELVGNERYALAFLFDCRAQDTVTRNRVFVAVQLLLHFRKCSQRRVDGQPLLPDHAGD